MYNPHEILYEDDTIPEAHQKLKSSPSTSFNSLPKWIIPFDNMLIRDSLGRGAVGDFYKANLDGKEVNEAIFQEECDVNEL